MAARDGAQEGQDRPQEMVIGLAVALLRRGEQPLPALIGPAVAAVGQFGLLAGIV